MRKFLKRICGDRNGNAMVLTVVGSTALIGGGGLAVDTVQWYLWKRQLQQAVDSSALAGGQAISQGTDSKSYALKELQRNGHDANAVERMATPPVTGDFAGDNQAMEVVASIRRPLPFSSLFLDTPPRIGARSVAASVASGKHCVISLAKDGVGISGSGSATINLGCGMASNSRAANAIDFGGTSYFEASPLSAVGGIEYDSDNIGSGTQIIPYTVAQRDPIAGRGLFVPSSPAACTHNNLTVNPNESLTISPGRYCNGLTVRGDLTMSPGVYLVDKGSFKVNSQATVRGEGVTIILTGNTPSNVATIDIQGGADIQLRAPSEEEHPIWKNILFYQNPSADYSTSKINGDSQLYMQGVVYLPKGTIRFNGASGQHSECLLLVAHRVNFFGNSSLSDNCPPDFGDVDMGARRVRVVE
jgi:hypothetical protein